MPAIPFVFYQGDVKPIVIQNVASSTGAAIASATCTLTDHVSGNTIGSANAAMTKSGTTIISPQFTWDTAGSFVLRVAVTFADGVVDNSIVGYVTVLPSAT